jgi:hypothetical protein
MVLPISSLKSARFRAEFTGVGPVCCTDQRTPFLAQVWDEASAHSCWLRHFMATVLVSFATLFQLMRDAPKLPHLSVDKLNVIDIIWNPK